MSTQASGEGNQGTPGQTSIFSVSERAGPIDVGVIYLAAIMQGLALVTFPAASSIFTGPDGFDFDSTRYGSMFLPQVALAIIASGLAPKLARRWSLRRVLLLGLAGDIAAMALLSLSRLLLHAPDLAFGVLLIATGALGFGFGSAVVALNTYTEKFFPNDADRAVLVLNALLGLGTALAPALVAVVVAIGIWWLLPVGVACILLLIFSVALAARLTAGLTMVSSEAPETIAWRNLPRRVWIYAAAVFLYGIAETLNGNWAPFYLSSERGVSAQGASLALTAFWLMVTAGRVLIAMISRFLPARWVYIALPILLIIAFQLASRVDSEAGGILAFGFAGLACCAFLPLSISFGGKEFPHLTAAMAGGMIAFYQLGYGVAAFGTGPLQDLIGLPLSTIYGIGSIIAATLLISACLISWRAAAPIWDQAEPPK